MQILPAGLGVLVVVDEYLGSRKRQQCRRLDVLLDDVLLVELQIDTGRERSEVLTDRWVRVGLVATCKAGIDHERIEIVPEPVGGAHKNHREIADALRVRFIVEGSVQHEGQDVGEKNIEELAAFENVWCKKFLLGRQEKLENNVSFLNLF